jgi:hypothetical protein
MHGHRSPHCVSQAKGYGCLYIGVNARFLWLSFALLDSADPGSNSRDSLSHQALHLKGQHALGGWNGGPFVKVKCGSSDCGSSGPATRSPHCPVIRHVLIKNREHLRVRILGHVYLAPATFGRPPMIVTTVLNLCGRVSNKCGQYGRRPVRIEVRPGG